MWQSYRQVQQFIVGAIGVHNFVYFHRQRERERETLLHLAGHSGNLLAGEVPAACVAVSRKSPMPLCHCESPVSNMDGEETIAEHFV